MSHLVRRRVFTRVAIGLLLLGAMPQPASAFTPNVEREWNHFRECLPLMIKDPAVHARLCSPFPDVPSLKSLSEPVIGAPVPVATPPVVVPPVTPPKLCLGGGVPRYGECPPPS